MKTENIGCFGWIAILGYFGLGFGFLNYAFSDSNEIFGYLDISFLVIGIIIPIIIIAKLYSIHRLRRIFGIFYKITLALSLLGLSSIIIELFDKKFLNYQELISPLIILSVIFLASGFLFFLFDIKPRILNKKRLDQKKKRYNELMVEGKNKVSNINNDFIKKLKDVYGDRFLYDEVEIQKFNGVDPKLDKVLISRNDLFFLTCRKHNIKFQQSFHNAFKSRGCQECELENNFIEAKSNKSLIADDVIQNNLVDKLNNLFGNKYDFSQVNYTDMNSKVSVKCPYHGVFLIKPKMLLKGVGCSICNLEGEQSFSTSNKKIKKGNNLNFASPADHKNNEVVVSLEEQENIIKILEKISKDINSTKKTGEKTYKKVEKIDKNVNVLLDIEKIKASCDKEKVDGCIDKIITLIENQYDFKNIKSFDKLVKKWFDFWNSLEPLSRQFMSQSEFIYQSIESSNFKDYSPYVLYSCRALEYELLQKIFIKFHQYLDSNYSDKNKLFEYDSEKVKAKTIKDIESGMMKSFKDKILKNSPKYTLGDMRLILNLLPTKVKPKASERYKALLALQEFNKFINDKIGEIPTVLIKKIELIISDYRNPSAHVGTIGKGKADSFRENYKELMNELLGLFK